jgi:thioredoxin reductase (NADPH)
LGCNVFTLPSRHSGKPVISETLTTFTPASLKVLAVPPVEKAIEKVDGENFLQRIYFNDGTNEEIDGLFIANDSASSIDFARKLGVIARENSIVVDEYQMTNVEGLFAAGDCTGGFKQVSTAVGQGALAGKKISEYIRNQKKI